MLAKLQFLKRMSYLMLTAMVVGLTLPGQVRGVEPLRIGSIGWTDAEVTVEIARRLLQEHLNQPVAVVEFYSLALQYEALAKGDIDVMLAAWIPLHQMFIDKISKKVETLGVLYDGARVGWIVPGHVPEEKLASIEQLRNPEVYDRLQGQIVGVEPRSGIMYLSEKTLEIYDLEGYELVPNEEGEMIATLNEAMENKEWLVVVGWSPHWMFVYRDLRYLKDPKKTLGGRQTVYTLGRKGLRQDYPMVERFFRNFRISLRAMEDIMLLATEVPVEEAVDSYLKDHPKLVQQWVEFLLPPRTAD